MCVYPPKVVKYQPSNPPLRHPEGRVARREGLLQRPVDRLVARRVALIGAVSRPGTVIDGRRRRRHMEARERAGLQCTHLPGANEGLPPEIEAICGCIAVVARL